MDMMTEYRAFVASLTYGEEPVPMTVADAEYTLQQWKEEGSIEPPPGFTAEIYAELWNGWCGHQPVVKSTLEDHVASVQSTVDHAVGAYNAAHDAFTANHTTDTLAALKQAQSFFEGGCMCVSAAGYSLISTAGSIGQTVIIPDAERA